MSKRKVIVDDSNGTNDVTNEREENPAKLLKADIEPNQGICDINCDDEREDEEEEDKIDKVRSGNRVRSRILKKKAESAKLRFCQIDDPIIESVGTKIKSSKRRRTWELWSKDDKTIFFDALREYGKDFDKIQNHFQQKITRKNLPAHYIKNKEQIRHFYYRTWHKLKVYINFTGDLKKSTKEIYGLVNYGELWKKVGSTLDEKSGARLNELVQKGGVTIKINGKNVRIKTPVCRALKRINQKHEASSIQSKLQSKLPEKIVVELRPRETGDWYRVHNVAHNPFVRVSLGLRRRISSLTKSLNVKWRHGEEKLKEAFLSELGKSLPEEESKDELLLLPPKGAKVNVPVIKAMPPLTSASLSLLSYKKKKNGESDKGKRLKIRIKLNVKEGSGDEASHSIVDLENGDEPAGEDDLAEDIDGPPLEDMEMAEDIIVGDFLMEESDQEASRSPPLPGDVSDPDSDAELLEEIKDSKIDDIEDDYLEDEDVPKEVDLKEEDIIDEVSKDEVDGKEEDIKEELDGDFENHDPTSGWSEATAGSLTIGEVYLMLGGDGQSVLRLDYHWRPVEVNLESAIDNKPVTVNDCFNKIVVDCGIKGENDCINKASNDVNKAGNSCGNLMSRLVKLASASGCGKQGKERKTSVSTSSPSVRFVSPGAGSRSPVSRPSPGSRGTVAKQLPLPPAGAERAGSPLAVPLDQGTSEPEFRMPQAPAARQGAIRDAAFREQIGQLMPKFTNRRGRTNRSRARQTVVGRQLLQPNIAPMPEAVTVQVIQPMAVNGQLLNLPRQHILVGPAPIMVAARDNEPSSSIQLHNITSTNQPSSPPQIHIPSPAPSPAHRRTPSPTPSLSSFLDCFPSTPQPPTTPNKSDQFLAMYEGGDSSLLQTPPRPAATPPTSPSRCLADSNDVSLGSWSLGALSFESPMKQISGQIPPSEDSQTSVISNSSEVERAVNAMMNENSVDFTASFRQLVKQCNSSDNE